MLSLSNQLRGSISTALLVTLIDRRTDLHYSDLAALATLHSSATGPAHGSVDSPDRAVVAATRAAHGFVKGAAAAVP